MYLNEDRNLSYRLSIGVVLPRCRDNSSSILARYVLISHPSALLIFLFFLPSLLSSLSHLLSLHNRLVHTHRPIQPTRLSMQALEQRVIHQAGLLRDLSLRPICKQLSFQHPLLEYRTFHYLACYIWVSEEVFVPRGDGGERRHPVISAPKAQSYGGKQQNGRERQTQTHVAYPSDPKLSRIICGI